MLQERIAKRAAQLAHDETMALASQIGAFIQDTLQGVPSDGAGWTARGEFRRHVGRAIAGDNATARNDALRDAADVLAHWRQRAIEDRIMAHLMAGIETDPAEEVES